jgi:hypothetical protein
MEIIRKHQSIKRLGDSISALSISLVDLKEKLLSVSTVMSHFLIEAAGHVSGAFRLCQATLRHENLCHVKRADEDEIK